MVVLFATYSAFTNLSSPAAVWNVISKRKGGRIPLCTKTGLSKRLQFNSVGLNLISLPSQSLCYGV